MQGDIRFERTSTSTDSTAATASKNATHPASTEKSLLGGAAGTRILYYRLRVDERNIFLTESGGQDVMA
jgi:hypothetical protein